MASEKRKDAQSSHHEHLDRSDSRSRISGLWDRCVAREEGDSQEGQGNPGSSGGRGELAEAGASNGELREILRARIEREEEERRSAVVEDQHQLVSDLGPTHYSFQPGRDLPEEIYDAGGVCQTGKIAGENGATEGHTRREAESECTGFDTDASIPREEKWEDITGVIEIARQVAPVTGRGIKNQREVAKKRARFNAIFKDLIGVMSIIP